MRTQAKTVEVVTPQAEVPVIISAPQKGPMEGMIIVGGRPQMERSDMPTISFESILAIQRATEKK